MSIKCCHDSQKKEYRNPGGAVPSGTLLTIRLKAEAESGPVLCRLNLWQETKGDERLAMERELSEKEEVFSVSFVTPEPKLCWYYFVIESQEGVFYYGNNPEQSGGEGQLYDHIPPAFQITVYRPEPVPAWYKNAIVYQIFPDRFARSEDWMERQMAADPGPDWKGPGRVIQQNWNDRPYYTKNAKGEVTRWPFFGGTLAGIRGRLFYLKSMGVGAVYLNPIFAASSNHKYDTADYFQIDPSFGTLEDFRRLARDAERLGIRLILDGVFNHTGADSLYFNQFGNYPGPGACQGPESPYYSWYRFSRFPDEYECWWGVGSLPNVNEEDPGYRKFLYENEDSVIRYWLREGASGWRLDVADELPDSCVSGIRKAVKETDPEGLLLGEVWEDASNKVSYGVQRRYLLGDELDSVMNYPFRDLLTDFIRQRCSAKALVKGLRSLAENYPPESFYGALNLVGSHDRIRILTLLGEGPEGLSDMEKEAYRLPGDKLELARKRLKALSLLQYVLPGVPCLYYGDEAGVQGFEDPYNRGTYPWGREDQELLAHYRTLALLRKQYSFLASGKFAFDWEGERVCVIRRWSESGEEALIAAVNNHPSEGALLHLKLPRGTGYALELLHSEEISFEGSEIFAELPPLGAKLFYCRGSAPARLELARSAGVLCHVSSLPGGGLDERAEEFIDYLRDAGQKLWQILPLNPADENRSPYSSPALFAGDTRLLSSSGQTEPKKREYEAFCGKEAFWLEDYALYQVLKKAFRGRPWQQWPEAEKNRRGLDYWREKKADELEQIKKEQFLFWDRWNKIRMYAKGKGISIIGDLPVYAGTDSADTWAHREVFLLDKYGYPLAGAGVPPDSFNAKGQNWGNPLYDWDELKKTGYDWWVKRMSRAMERFDYIRLDHFRGFSAFYAVPQGKEPCGGWWLPGPGKDFFGALAEKLGPLPLLAEDLGLLDPQVHNLLKLTGCPGMLVYQFSAGEMETMEEPYKVFYSGTHDNQTLAGWCRDCGVKDPQRIIETLYESPAPWVIIPLQDHLGLGDECRMNIPGQAEGNWTWRADDSQLTPELAARLKKLASDTRR
ncbi:4-alpha-glucanotransferase [bacterium 210820-DFI.6.37]|nr:4-alpha-glucanotransferase [bacterium 210820-DFI.6.37]